METSRQNRLKLRVVYFEADESIADNHSPVLSEEASGRGRTWAVLRDIAAHGAGLLLLALAIWLIGPSVAKAVLMLLATIILGAVLFCAWGSE